jgi:hypothetical protein
MMSNESAAGVSEPVVAEVVPPPRPMQFGLRTLLLVMAVCSAQFAVMSYAGVLPGVIISLLLACLAFAGVFLIGMFPGLFPASQVQHLDRLIVWLMIAILVLFFGTTLAGGGVAAWQSAMRIKNEAWLERIIGAGLKRQMRVDQDGARQVLVVMSVRAGSPADQAGLKTGEVLVMGTTIDQFYRFLQTNRGKDVELTVAICGPTQQLDTAPQRTAVLSVPR